jgi:hypothetical protein
MSAENERSNVRQFARGDASRLHCHTGRKTRVRRFNAQIPPASPPPSRFTRTELWVAWGLISFLGLFSLYLLLDGLYSSVGVR